jgi:hypothetical protein
MGAVGSSEHTASEIRSLSYLDRRRHEKFPAFDTGRITVYWIIALVVRRIEACTSPDRSAEPLLRSATRETLRWIPSLRLRLRER